MIYPTRSSKGFSTATLICAIALAGCGGDSAVASKREAISRLDALIQKGDEASQFARQWRDIGDRAPDAILQKMSDYYDAVLQDSHNVNYAALDSAYPQLGTMLRDTLIKSYSLNAECIREWMQARSAGASLKITPDFYQKATEAGRLEQEWANWFNSHFDDINKAIQ